MCFKNILLSILFLSCFCFSQDINLSDENIINRIITTTEKLADDNFLAQNHQIETTYVFKDFCSVKENNKGLDPLEKILKNIPLAFDIKSLKIKLLINRPNIFAFFYKAYPEDPKLTYVAKMSDTREEKDHLSILSFLKRKNCLMFVALPLCFISIGRNTYCTLYDAAEGTRSDILIKKFVPGSNPAYVFGIMRTIGDALFTFHDKLRPDIHETFFFMVSQNANLKIYSENTEDRPSKTLCVPENLFLGRFLLSVNHGDLHTGNIFITDEGKVTFIDYLSMVRDLPGRNGFSSITNDLSYFIACTFCYHRKSLKKALGGSNEDLGREILLNAMVHFLAGYLCNIPEEHHDNLINYTQNNYSFLLKNLILPNPEEEQTRDHFNMLFSKLIIPKTKKILSLYLVQKYFNLWLCRHKK